MFTELTEEQCLAAISAGDFTEEITGAAAQVAIVLTQGWCPEWRVMRPMIVPNETFPDTKVFYVEYDQKPWFEDFMTFKEQTYHNHFVPYVRYFKNGTFVGESNFVGPEQFWRAFTAAP